MNKAAGEFFREIAAEALTAAVERERLAEQFRREAELLRRRAKACEEMADVADEDASARRADPMRLSGLPPTAPAVQYAAIILGRTPHTALRFEEVAEKAIKGGYCGFDPATSEKTAIDSFRRQMRSRPDVFHEAPGLRFTLACSAEEAMRRLRTRRTRKQPRTGKWVERLIQYLREHGPTRWADLVDQMDAPSGSISKALQKPYFKTVDRGVWDVDEDVIERLGGPAFASRASGKPR